MEAAPPHIRAMARASLALDDDKLWAECDVDLFVASGPGGRSAKERRLSAADSPGSAPCAPSDLPRSHTRSTFRAPCAVGSRSFCFYGPCYHFSLLWRSHCGCPLRPSARRSVPAAQSRRFPATASTTSPPRFTWRILSCFPTPTPEASAPPSATECPCPCSTASRSESAAPQQSGTSPRKDSCSKTAPHS